MVLLDRSTSMRQHGEEAVSGCIDAVTRGPARHAVVMFFTERPFLAYEGPSGAAAGDAVAKAAISTPCKGQTAYYDSVVCAVAKVERRRPGDSVVLVVATDGADNASKIVTAEACSKVLKRVQEVSGWEVRFLGIAHRHGAGRRELTRSARISGVIQPPTFCQSPRTVHETICGLSRGLARRRTTNDHTQTIG